MEKCGVSFYIKTLRSLLHYVLRLIKVLTKGALDGYPSLFKVASLVFWLIGAQGVFPKQDRNQLIDYQRFKTVTLFNS